MSKEKDGGPAFACAAENAHQEGMSLRDYFAAQTITGMVWEGAEHATELSIRAYLFADAMLAERAKTGDR